MSKFKQYLLIPKIKLDGSVGHVTLAFENLGNKDDFIARYVQLAEQVRRSNQQYELYRSSDEQSDFPHDTITICEAVPSGYTHQHLGIQAGTKSDIDGPQNISIDSGGSLTFLISHGHDTNCEGEKEYEGRVCMPCDNKKSSSRKFHVLPSADSSKIQKNKGQENSWVNSGDSRGLLEQCAKGSKKSENALQEK